jgi:phytoene dehydrogenase-like protein
MASILTPSVDALVAELARLPGIGLFRSLHQANAHAFSDSRLVQLFDRYATYNGSSPFKTPATMRIIPHVEYSWGGWAVEGGIVEVARSLERAALHCGARLHCNTRVQDIGLSADGRRVSFNPTRAGVSAAIG